MNKRKLLLICIFSLFTISGIYAEDLTWETFMTNYFTLYSADKNIPPSYEYIQLKYKNIKKGTPIYHALQKAVYLNAMPNIEIQFPLNKKIKQKYATSMFEMHFHKKIPYKINQYVTDTWLKKTLKNLLKEQREREGNTAEVNGKTITLTDQEKIMQDVYKIITNKYIDAENLNSTTLEYGAIKGMVEAVDDKYTVYFPPQEAYDFKQSLEGQYEGIGAYVDMPEPGKFIIISPLKNSPAEQAGLEGGDIVTHINGEKITKNMNTKTIINKIKGRAGTTVQLTIFREGVSFDKTLTRQKITLNDIESDETMPKGICYLKLNLFSSTISQNFGEELNKLTNCNKYIFDLRNNPGGSLREVAQMLNYFVPTGETTVLIKTKESEQRYKSHDIIGEKLTNKKIIILINKGSASASEIFAGTIKDYGSNVTLMGEKSFGKGSVQEVISYQDGSVLKFTVAKRFTGKSEINVTDNGIDPDIIISDNKETKKDEPLEKAKTY